MNRQYFLIGEHNPIIIVVSLAIKQQLWII